MEHTTSTENKHGINVIKSRSIEINRGIFQGDSLSNVGTKYVELKGS